MGDLKVSLFWVNGPCFHAVLWGRSLFSRLKVRRSPLVTPRFELLLMRHDVILLDIKMGSL